MCHRYYFQQDQDLRMDLELEPPLKKQRTVNTYLPDDTIDIWIDKIKSSDQNLSPVVSDEFNEPIKLGKVYVGYIRNVQDISKAVMTLNEKIPLKDLQHLKRVKRQNIILCPISSLNSETIQEYIEKNVGELKDIFDYFQVLEVPFIAPRVTRQYQETKKYWPCNFHPNHYWEKLVRDSFFSDHELLIHKKYMEVVFEIVKWQATCLQIKLCDAGLQDINASVVVDPDINKIVTIAFDHRQTHPLQHTAMIAIDNVARTQNGGVWDSNISDDLMINLKEKFGINFGVRDSNKNSKEGPYLCTGYNMYILREPCHMCSMALVHARTKRIFFCIDNEEKGALKSTVKLQTISSLNHHFEVFTGFL